MPTKIPNSQTVFDILAPTNYEDTIPVYDYRYGLGGFRTVGSTTDLLIPSGAGEATNQATPDRSITSLRRKKGMVVYVEGVTAFYGLFSSTADSSWEIVGPSYFRGGIRSLATTAQMESIRDEMREEGMIVYVSGVTAYYALIGTTANSGWTTGFTFGSGGGIVGDYVTTFNGLSGAVQGVSAAIAGSGIAVDAATGSVTITNIGVVSFNGRTGAVDGASLGANTFTELNTFSAGISASGATVSGRLDVGGVLDVVGGVTLESTLDVVGAARFVGGLSAARVYVSQGSTFIGPVTFAGITATSVNTGTLATTGLATLNSLSVTDNATIGGTLDVYGNLYVRGTVATVNETQLLIEDKYLVLGSTYNVSSLGASGGLYLGNTGSPFASFVYNDTLKSWDSNKNVNVLGAGATGYYINGTLIASGLTIGNSNTDWGGKPIPQSKGGLGVSVINQGYVRFDNSGVASFIDHPNSAFLPNPIGNYDTTIVSIKTSDGGTIDFSTTAENTNEYHPLKTTGKQSISGYLSPATGNVWEGKAGSTAFNADTGHQGATLTIPLLSKRNVDWQNNYVFWDDRSDFNLGYNVNTGTVYFKQIEAIVDGGTW